MIYGTIDEIAEVEERSLKMGRLVAASQFTKALLEHGSFDEYRFYCASVAGIEETRQRLEASVDKEALDRAILMLQPNLHGDLASTEFGVLHYSNGWAMLASLAMIRNRFAMKPFPVTSQIHSLNEPNAPLRALRVALSRPKPYDAIICSSEAGRRTLQSFFEILAERLPELGAKPTFPGELAKIPLAIDDSKFVPQDAAKCREALGLPRDATILLHLGRISAHDKGDPAPLFHVFRQLLRDRPQQNLLLVMAGGADEANIQSFRESCRELGIAERVIFRPNFEDEQKPLYYGAADIFVSWIDSLQETFGLAVVEAMACGKAVLVSDFDGYREIVENGKSGMTIPTIWGPADGFLEGVSSILNPKVHQLFLAQSIVIDIPSAYASALKLIDDPALRNQLGQAARQRAVSEFSWKAVIPRYEALWKELGARADADKTKSEPGPDPFQPDFFRSFSHYPSKIVSGQWKASLTDFGKEALSGKSAFPTMYSHVGVLLSEPWLKLILQRLSRGPCSIGELLGLAAQTLGAHDEHMLYHLLWLAKHDVISLRESAN